jgi:hypothetical protein
MDQFVNLSLMLPADLLGLARRLVLCAFGSKVVVVGLVAYLFLGFAHELFCLVLCLVDEISHVNSSKSIVLLVRGSYTRDRGR